MKGSQHQGWKIGSVGLLSLAFLFFSLGVSYAQVNKTVTKKSERTQKQIDSVKSVSDSLANVQLKKLRELNLDAAKHNADSLNRTLAKTVSGKPDSVKQAIQNNVDRIGIPKAFGSKSDSIADKARGFGANLQQTASDEVKILQQGNVVNTPDAKVPELPAIGLPGKEVPPSSLPSVSQALSGTSIPTGKADVSLPKTELDLTTPQVPNIKLPELPSTALPSINAQLDPKALPEVGEITGNLNKSPDSTALDMLSRVPEVDPGKAKEVTSGIQDAKRYRTKLDTMDLEALGVEGAGALEAKASEMAEVKGMSQEMNSAMALKMQQEAMLERYRDKRRLHDEITRKAKNVVNVKINELTPEFKSAQDDLMKTKRLNPAVQSFKEMVRKRPNEMKDRPLRERLIPGISIQAYNSDPFTIDFGPQIGYRFTGRWTAGVGPVFRAAFSSNFTHLVKTQGVFGAKTYVNWEVLRATLVHAEFEYLAVDQSAFSSTLEPATPEVLGSYFGIGRRYALSRKVNLTISALYRVEIAGHLPGMNPINLRVILEMKPKRRSIAPK